MSVRPLRYLGDPVLRTPSDPVTRFDDALSSLIEDLLDGVREPGRAGLAANQIGSSLAAFAYSVDGQLGYLINPRIVERSGDDYGPEACLSIPGLSALRHRSASVTAAGVNLQQERVVVTGAGELARALQHETDHLNGELFIDGLDSGERRRVMRLIGGQLVTGSSADAASQRSDRR
jgi:peptide deformylase